MLTYYDYVELYLETPREVLSFEQEYDDWLNEHNHEPTDEELAAEYEAIFGEE